MTETPDPALAIIEALEARDPRALELLYHRFGETLGGIAVRFGWGDNQRLLFAHEVIWKIFDLYLRKNQPQLKDRNAFPGWVRKVAFRVAVDQVRGGARLDPLGDDREARGHTPEREAILREMLKLTSEYLREVEPTWLVAVEGQLDGLTYEQIAELLELSTLGVKKRLYKLRRKLKALFGGEVP